MTGPDFKQLKESFDRFAEEAVQEDTTNENVGAMLKQALGSPMSRLTADLVQRRDAAKKKYNEAKELQPTAIYWLTGKHPADRARLKRRHMSKKFKTQGGQYDNTNARIRQAGLRGWATSKSYITMAALNGSTKNYPDKEYGTSWRPDPGKPLALSYIQELKKDLSIASAEKNKGSQSWPSEKLAQNYFCSGYNRGKCDVEDSVASMKRVSQGDPQKAWQSIIWRISPYIKYYQEFIRFNDAELANYEKNLASSTRAMEEAQQEFEQTTAAIKKHEQAFKNAKEQGAPTEEALKLADKAAGESISDHDKARAAKAAAKPAAKPPEPAAKTKKTRVKVAADDPEAQSLVFESEILTEQHEADAERTKIMNKLVDLSMEIQGFLRNNESPVETIGPDVAQLARDLISLKRTYCIKPQKDSLTAKFCKDLKSDIAQTKQTAALFRKAKAEIGKKGAEKVDMGSGRRTAKGKTSMRRKRGKKKERCGKAPKGQYGSRGFKPKPFKLTTAAAKKKYPETKKVFDQFYADLKEFGVKITKDYWWGKTHKRVYNRILCKLDEKSAKPKESGEVDYKLANKYNANRQRLGVPILTGDQLKKDYLSKLIRGGMHMGLSHEESDKLIGGRRKGAAEPVKKKKAKAVGGREGVDAYRDSLSILDMAKGYTDGEEEQKITAIVRKYLVQGNIGVLFNAYGGVLKEKGETDRGDLVRELYHEDLNELAAEVRRALQRETRGRDVFGEGKVDPANNKVVYGGKTFDLNKLVEFISKGQIKDYRSLKHEIRKKAIMENKTTRAVQSTSVAHIWIMNWLKDNIGN